MPFRGVTFLIGTICIAVCQVAMVAGLAQAQQPAAEAPAGDTTDDSQRDAAGSGGHRGDRQEG